MSVHVLKCRRGVMILKLRVVPNVCSGFPKRFGLSMGLSTWPSRVSEGRVVFEMENQE